MKVKEIKKVFITVILGLALSGCGSVSDDEDPPTTPELTPKDNAQAITFTPASDATNSVTLSSEGDELVSCHLTQGTLYATLAPFGNDLETSAQLEGTANVECNIESIWGPISIKMALTVTCDDPDIESCKAVYFSVNNTKTKGTFYGDAVQIKMNATFENGQTLFQQGFSSPIALVYDFGSNKIGLEEVVDETLNCDDSDSEAVRFIEDELGLPCPSGTSVSITANIALTANPPITTP